MHGPTPRPWDEPWLVVWLCSCESDKLPLWGQQQIIYHPPQASWQAQPVLGHGLHLHPSTTAVLRALLPSMRPDNHTKPN